MSGFENIEQKTPREPTLNEALRTIDVLEQNVFQTGRVDVEPDLFKGLRRSLEQGELSPADAIKRANDILESRQDYN